MFYAISKKKLIGKFNSITQIINKTPNNNVPNTDPCGTPAVAFKGNDRTRNKVKGTAKLKVSDINVMRTTYRSTKIKLSD
jgi:hypothetical protein